MWGESKQNGERATTGVEGTEGSVAGVWLLILRREHLNGMRKMFAGGAGMLPMSQALVSQHQKQTSLWSVHATAFDGSLEQGSVLGAGNSRGQDRQAL